MREPIVACLCFLCLFIFCFMLFFVCLFFVLCSSIYYFRGAPKSPKSKEGIPKEVIPKEAIPKEAIPKEGIPKETIPKEGIPKEGIPKEAIPKEAIPKEAIPKEAIPKEAIPKEAIPKEAINCFLFIEKEAIASFGDFLVSFCEILLWVERLACISNCLVRQTFLVTNPNKSRRQIVVCPPVYAAGV
jgi:hypothetical protein